ncbi:copper homeostasis protein [Blastocystis sp. subtype 4]|uniref:copper homeostasis protein n=1 Tax=Blastocystis sp. subtype 4 TaxID=944170 RepID=UPI000711644F|nr:copper homeostasis protein [Blastocystis sp. subtype 4]KNB42483.1 copper homeostasis protein [Blastocystis sp. subtype 4]|eukprot:XP_014525920.1 copper homeostasis protein [Blastocystis sp. subtype 4]
MLLEVCIDRVESAVNAEKGGAGRVELCDNLVDGGTTPSYGMIKLVKESISIPVNVIIRPRGGDFFYNENEMRVMLEDIEACKRIGVNGVVIGCLTEDGKVDMEKNRRLIEAARPLSVTFHRAIDMTVDPLQATKNCIELKVDRILTSGGCNTVMEGKDTIREMVRIADGHLQIMAGGGVTGSNIRELVQYTGVKEVHGSARDYVCSAMKYRKQGVFMGGEKKNTQELEFKWKQTSEQVVQQFVSAIADL